MATYSLLQVSLAQTIDRQSLEDASVVIPSVAKADCAKLQRELFGILVSGLEADEARLFQIELHHRNFPTELVADHDLPRLHEPFTFQRLEVSGDVLNFTDSMGHTRMRKMSDLVFLAGGFLVELEMRVEKSLKLKTSGKGSYPGYVLHRKTEMKTVPKFILDFFFSNEPHRLQAKIIPENVVFHQGIPLRLKYPEQIVAAMAQLRLLLPRDRLNSGLLRNDAAAAYPNFESYEEEIRWKFYRLMNAE